MLFKSRFGESILSNEIKLNLIAWKKDMIVNNIDAAIKYKLNLSFINTLKLCFIEIKLLKIKNIEDKPSAEGKRKIPARKNFLPTFMEFKFLFRRV